MNPFQSFSNPEFLSNTFHSVAVAGQFIFNSPKWLGFIFVIKIFSAISIIAMTVAIVMLLIRAQYFAPHIESVSGFFSANPKAKKSKLAKTWEDIESRLRRNIPDDDRAVLIEADNVFDATLRELEHKGRIMEERLRGIEDQISNMDEILASHALRNQAVHQPGSKISHIDAENALRTYRAALKEIGILE